MKIFVKIIKITIFIPLKSKFMKINIYCIVLVMAALSFSCQSQDSTEGKSGQEKSTADTSAAVEEDKPVECPPMVAEYEEAVDRFIELSFEVSKTKDTSLLEEFDEVKNKLIDLEAAIKNSDEQLAPDCVVRVQSAAGKFMIDLKDYIN